MDLNLHQYLWLAIIALVVSLVALVVDRILTHYIKRFARVREIPPEVGNGMVLVSRLLILIAVGTTLLRVGGVPTEWLTVVSTLGGAAIGFASTRSIGNLIAGLYVLAVRPFKINDYVSIGDVEGIVSEITINYTKVLTSHGYLVLLSNQKVLDQNVINYRYGDKGKSSIYRYPIQVGFAPSEFTLERADRLIKELEKRLKGRMPSKIEFRLLRQTSTEVVCVFYVHASRAEDLMTLPRDFLRELSTAWTLMKSSDS